MMPAQSPAGGMAPMMGHHFAGGPGPGPGPARSHRTLYIAIGAVAAVSIGVAVAIASRGGGGRDGGGGGGGGEGGLATSLDDAVQRTFAAMGKGDLEGLMGNAGSDYLKTLSECDASQTDPERDQKEREDMRLEMSRLARREQGASFQVKRTETTEVITMKQGEKAGKGCKLARDVNVHQLKVALEITRDGATAAQQGTMKVYEADGKFFVMTAPKLEGCSAAIARVMLLEQRTGESRSLDMKQCAAEKWSADAIKCVSDSVTLPQVDRCLAKR